MENQKDPEIYSNPGSEPEQASVPEKKGSAVTIVIIVILVLVLLLICCCSGVGIYGAWRWYREQTAPVAYKPVIYLYPDEETDVTVRVSNPERFTVTYPEYPQEAGWKVHAAPDGNLTDPVTLRTYYSLYYESELPKELDFQAKEGFLVKGEDTAEFLEEKLSILGLTDREAEEMIIYWLPQMSQNEYNLIRFATEEEIDEAMSLNISPEPDSVIRVWMVWEGADAEEAETLKEELMEQTLTTPERNGFTVVEWGGVPVTD